MPLWQGWLLAVLRGYLLPALLMNWGSKLLWILECNHGSVFSGEWEAVSHESPWLHVIFLPAETTADMVQLEEFHGAAPGINC